MPDTPDPDPRLPPAAPGPGPVTVEAQRAGLISLDTGGAVMLASVSFVLGLIGGGIILPFLTTDHPDMNRQQEELERDAVLGQLRASLAPLGIWAPPAVGSPAVATGLSLGQLIEELDFRGQRAGQASEVSVTRDGGIVKVDLAFEPVPDGAVRVAPQRPAPDAPDAGHPRLIRLVLAAGPEPGTLVLTETLADGRPLPTGASFVDLVAMGGIAPPLPDGQTLTRLGVFEIRTGPDGGQAAFLDGRRVYPAASGGPGSGSGTGSGPAPSSGPDLDRGLPGSAAAAAPGLAARDAFTPVRLGIASQEPASGPFRAQLVLVAAPAADGPCTARAVILDTTRNAVQELPEPLLDRAVDVRALRDGLVLRGFCAPADRPSARPAGPAGAAASGGAPPLPGRVVLEAQYRIATGEVRWSRISEPPPPAAAPAAAAAVAGPWRSTPGRLASPIQPGGGLVSVSCARDGGLAVAAAGLPAPPAGEQGLTVVFRTAAGTAPARMRWIGTSATYELASAARPREAAAVAGVLRAGGPVTVTGGGRTHVLPAPGAAALDALRARCAAVDGQAAARRPAPAPVAEGPPPVVRPPDPGPARAPSPAAAPAATPDPDPDPQRQP